MAALPETRAPELVDLWQVRVDELEPLLEEETLAWREQLAWDFRASADLVRRFIEVRALSGFALLAGAEVAGYAYSVSEEHKGLIGDLYLRAKFRTAENERSLLEAVLGRLMPTRGIRRVEAQLMLARADPQRQLPAAPYGCMHRRNFMLYDLGGVSRLPARRAAGMLFDHWSERRQDEAAHLIAAAYRGHIDSQINDQYRSAEGARRFLFNIVQYPGCGAFFEPAAWVALDSASGRVCGVSLTSMVAEDVGHVTQICVSPALRGQGVGYELLRRSLESLAETGARRVSLTVTTANENAVRLYENVGFRTLHHFPAFVWEGF
ncbi:MAG: GNAT family N-acetyltransferase [Bryobacteraceae bacterium]